MQQGVIELGVGGLLLASGLVGLAGGLSALMHLRLERRLTVAAVRTVVQLLLVGLVLRWVFAVEHPLAVLAVTLFMVVVASGAALKRTSRSYRGARLNTFVSLLVSGIVTLFVVAEVVIQVDPWYRPQYLIPLLGMILGNGLTGLSLCLDALMAALDEGKDAIEMELSLGASAWEAAQRPVQEALRIGMVPVINAMSVVGLVSIPGMMTGQILNGADPMTAVKYQIVVMFMIAAATAMSTILAAVLTFRRLFNEKHQLLPRSRW